MKFAVKFGSVRSVGPFEVMVTLEGDVKVAFTDPQTGDHYQKNMSLGDRMSTQDSSLKWLKSSKSHQTASFQLSEQKKPRLRTLRRQEARRNSAKNVY